MKLLLYKFEDGVDLHILYIKGRAFSSLIVGLVVDLV